MHVDPNIFMEIRLQRDGQMNRNQKRIATDIKNLKKKDICLYCDVKTI